MPTSVYIVAPGHRVRRPGSRERVPEGGEVRFRPSQGDRMVAEGILLASEPPSAGEQLSTPPADAAPHADAGDGGSDGLSPLDVECPHCGAPVGEPCVTASGSQRSPHKARALAAREAS